MLINRYLNCEELHNYRDFGSFLSRKKNKLTCCLRSSAEQNDELNRVSKSKNMNPKIFLSLDFFEDIF